MTLADVDAATGQYHDLAEHFETSGRRLHAHLGVGLSQRAQNGLLGSASAIRLRRCQADGGLYHTRFVGWLVWIGGHSRCCGVPAGCKPAHNNRGVEHGLTLHAYEKPIPSPRNDSAPLTRIRHTRPGRAERWPTVAAWRVLGRCQRRQEMVPAAPPTAVDTDERGRNRSCHSRHTQSGSRRTNDCSTGGTARRYRSPTSRPGVSGGHYAPRPLATRYLPGWCGCHRTRPHSPQAT